MAGIEVGAPCPFVEYVSVSLGDPTLGSKVTPHRVKANVCTPWTPGCLLANSPSVFLGVGFVLCSAPTWLFLVLGSSLVLKTETGVAGRMYAGCGTEKPRLESCGPLGKAHHAPSQYVWY